MWRFGVWFDRSEFAWLDKITFRLDGWTVRLDRTVIQVWLRFDRNGGGWIQVWLIIYVGLTLVSGNPELWCNWNTPRVGAQIPGFEYRLHEFFTFYIHINYSARGPGHLSICAKIDKKALHLMVIAKIWHFATFAFIEFNTMCRLLPHCATTAIWFFLSAAAPLNS